ncbi:hypothetical protein QEZ52_18305 [Aliisedimentitalea scapharcae]|uniref:Secreted protein n=1 Tax=Aliisedimentitalea scapharcae TaxID=1524259 RepID=A0ABZ2XRM8_9RHOB
MRYAPFLICLAAASPALADSPVIERVTATQTGSDWQFDVTLSHPDTGWDHYADGWRVLDMQGTELGLRVLAHPHEHEQPFTRSLSGVRIPNGTSQVQIQARCIVDGWGAQTVTVTLP